MNPTPHKKQAIVVAGPTCSGKSALAADLAQRIGGTIINADSMQVYAELHVLTARPGAAELALAPHALYGVRAAAEPGTAAWWRGAALAEMEAAHALGRTPILCGGTGMYLAVSLAGPGRHSRSRPGRPPGGPRRCSLPTGLPPCTPGSPRRTLAPRRGCALRMASASPARGRCGAAPAPAWPPGRFAPPWRHPPAGPPVPIVLDPPRAELRAAIAARFAHMLAHGALDEVRGLLALGLDPALPAMRAHGVPELAAHLRGALTLAEAANRAVLATGQYTRRQATWFRHRSVLPAGNAAETNTHRLVARYTCQTQLLDSFTSIS